MTTNDPAGDKLVASIRKTKTSVTSKAGPAKKTRARKTPAQQNAQPATVEKNAMESKTSDAGNRFQHGRRVWPD